VTVQTSADRRRDNFPLGVLSTIVDGTPYRQRRRGRDRTLTSEEAT
jgi:hypothetical protein